MKLLLICTGFIVGFIVATFLIIRTFGGFLKEMLSGLGEYWNR